MTPLGFWSYARGDDEHLDNRLSDLRARVAGEISMLLGEDIGMFQDIYDIRTGDDWEDKLRAALTDASFMVPVLTPRYFKRKWCREEVITLIRLSEEAGRAPLVFPIYFVADRRFDRRDHCEVRKALARFKPFDYRLLRFESDRTRIDKAIHDFASDVVDRLEDVAGPTPKPASKTKTAPGAAARRQTPVDAAEGAVREAPPPPAIPTLVVDQYSGRGGNHTTISAAIEAAEPGSRILIRPGRYRESLSLSKPLELIGDGERERIVVTTAEGTTLHCDAPMARVSGLTLQREVGEDGYCVWITGGGLELEDCNITSQSLVCVVVSGREAAPVLRRCVLRDTSRLGLYVINGARPVVEDCEIAGNAHPGVMVTGEGTHAVLRRCTLRDGKSSGLRFTDGATGLVEDCEVVGNAYAGVTITTDADPTLRACRVRSNNMSGVWVYEEGRGRIENCVISDNGGAGVDVDDCGAPVVRGCTISGNGNVAVLIKGAKSGGVFEENDLRGNAHGAWDVAEGAEKNLTRKGNRE